MAINNATNLYTETKYVVSSVGATAYGTIQAAINAANAAGIPAKIYIRPGTYTENLTLYSTISLEGSESSSVKIVGQHTPPASGNWSATRIEFECTGTDSILLSSSAGTTVLKFTRCSFIVPNGYIVNATNWTGNITFRYCVGGSSTQNGVVYNTGTSKVEIENSSLGNGTSNAMTVNGILSWNNADIKCPVTLTGSAVSLIQGGSTISGALTVGGSADLQISNSRITSGAAVGITTTSSVVVKLSGVIVDSLNTYAISGTGSIKPSELILPSSKNINATVTEVLTGAVRTGEIFADTITRMKYNGFYSWSAVGPYFDDTTLGSFTVLIGGTGYIKGRLVTWTGPQTVTSMTSGSTWWIYIDVNGTIGKTNSRTDAMFEDYIMLFSCLYDETTGTKVQLTAKENHPYSFPTSVSNYTHDIIGGVIENANNGANITLVGPANVKISISGADVLSDHGLDTTISDTSGVGVSWHKMYTNAAGKWAHQASITNPGDTFLGYYNNAGTPTALGGSKFGVYTLYVGKDNLNTSTPIYYAVLDTSQYNTSGAASTAIANGTTAKATNELYYLEMAQLGYLIFSQASGTITSVIISKSTLRSTTSTSGTNTASLVNTTTAAFDGILSATDTNVQTALNTIDEWGKTTTDHALLIGNGTGVAIGSLAIGTTGQILTGVTSNDPAWTTATYPATVTKGDVLVASANDVIGVVAGAATSGYVLTANGAGTAPTFQAAAAGGISTLAGDSGTATGSTVTIAGGVGVTTSASSATLTVSSTKTTLNTQTDSYTLVLGDAGKLIQMNKSTANTLTIPTNASVAFPVGTIIMVERLGAGATSIAPDSGVTLNSAGSATSLYAQYSVGGLIKTDTDIWVLYGDIA